MKVHSVKNPIKNDQEAGDYDPEQRGKKINQFVPGIAQNNQITRKGNLYSYYKYTSCFRK